jgi:hypothetical protein
MARLKKNAHLYELAKLGAHAQLSELLQEARLLIGLFPHLRDSFDKDELPVNFILRRGRDRARAKARTKPRWPAAKRQAAAARMKKYWATRRKSNKK